MDDEPDIVTTLLALLRGEGFIARGFASGVGALDALEEFNPDVIISDIAMPFPNGWDVARTVRQKMGDTRPVLIAITGQYRKGSDRVLAQISGFDHYLLKPFDPAFPLALIAPLVGK